jgi:hypothetical protein
LPDLILHHYDFSNYSEKVRGALGLQIAGMVERNRSAGSTEARLDSPMRFK